MTLAVVDFPVRRVEFGARTGYAHGVLTIDQSEALSLVREDGRILDARLDLVQPGESARVLNVDDVIPPMVKVDGPGCVYPGVVGRPVDGVGFGRTHRLTNFAVFECLDPRRDAGDSVTRRVRGESGVGAAIEMSGPGAFTPYSHLHGCVLTLEVDGSGGDEAHDEAKRGAAFRLADYLAATVANLNADPTATFDFEARDPSLPGVVLIANLRSSEHHVGPRSGIGTAVYGITRLSAPWLLRPTEVYDGAVTRKTTWYQVNNPALRALAARHGVDWNLLGVIVQRTNWTSLPEKLVVARRVGELAAMVGASGAVVTVDVRGNRFIEAAHGVQACEDLGVRTVLLTLEELSEDGQAPPVLFTTAGMEAIVSCGDGSVAGPFPPVSRALGVFEPTTADLGERPGHVGGHTGSGWPDYYGWGRRTCREF